LKLSGWGNYPVIDASVMSFEQRSELADLIGRPGALIARGMGRSYGDSAVSDRVVLTRRFDKFLDFDPGTGRLTCESGVTLAEIIDLFLPRGWFLSVTPGTKFITVGGAIASDVHGKNHHTAGCFSEFVSAFDLMLPGGEVVSCSREVNPELFRATCGGMGLTGVILSADLTLQPITSACIRETVMRCPNLEAVFNRFEEHAAATYSVAWIDCLARGEQVGRSVLMLGEHARTGLLELPARRMPSVPVYLPRFCLNRYSVALFNHLYYRAHPGHAADHRVPLDGFFYPLDSIGNWNRMYGRRGFTQYQLVRPKAASFEGLRTILNRISRAGLGSFLGVLKLFGPENGNLLSFPMEGYTLALDFKIEDRLFSFLNELDRVVLDHGGRLYLTKDVRMKPEMAISGYPRWAEFTRLRTTLGLKEKFVSRQSHRVGA
jgi:decaprenylphospho-beta-D-ribofuranose 2-oxidase